MNAAMTPTFSVKKSSRFYMFFFLIKSIIYSYVIRPVRGKMSMLMCIRIRFIYIIFFCIADFVSLSIRAAARSTKNGIMTTLTSNKIRVGIT